MTPLKKYRYHLIHPPRPGKVFVVTVNHAVKDALIHKGYVVVKREEIAEGDETSLLHLRRSD